MSFEQPISVSHDVVFQEIEGESVLLQLEDARYFGLDDVGTRIWQLILEHGKLDAVFEQMLNEYDVAPEKLRGDLEKLVRELADKKLLVLQASERGRDTEKF